MIELRPYQREAVSFLAHNDKTIYADAPGTGKTITSLTWLHEVDPQRALIAVPLSVLHHWQREAGRVGVQPVWTYRGSPKQREAALDGVRDEGGVLLTNYETLRGDVEKLLRVSWDLTIADEAHRLKNRKAQVTKAFTKLARRADLNTFVTGTPILNGAEELWSLLHMMYPRSFPSFWRWCHEHFETRVTDFGGRQRYPVTLIEGIREGHEDLLRTQLIGTMIQRPLGYLLPQLPEVTETTIEVDLSPEEKRAYKQMADFHWTEIEGEPIVTVNIVSRLTRLRQLASDWSGLSEGVKSGAKVTAALGLVNDLAPEQAVVFTSFKATAQRLISDLAKIGIPALPYTGDQSGAERESALLRFIGGEVRVLVGTHGALGEGVDGLQAATRHVVFIDRDWTPSRNEQAIARVRRSGQAAGVQVWNIVALGTVDEAVDEALSKKMSVIDSIIGRSAQEFLYGGAV